MIDYEIERSNKINYFYSQFDKNLCFPLHIHHSFEYIYCLNGEIELTIEENIFTLKSGQAAVIFPLQAHSYVTKKHSETCLFVFALSYVHTFYNEYKYKRPDDPIFNFAEYQYIHNGLLQENNIYLRKSYLYLIISHLVQNTTFREFEATATNVTIKIITYIRNNFNSAPSLTDLCNSLGYSYNYISGFIRHSFHSNFMQLINDYRISYARMLLINASDSITEIASKCGYNSLQSFNRNFKKIVGMTPTEFRDKNGQLP